MARKKSRSKPRKRSASTTSRKRVFSAPRTIEDYNAMSPPDQLFWNNVGAIVTDVRRRASLNQSSRAHGLDARKVRQAAASAFRKLKNGRYTAKDVDHILRVVLLPGRKGLREVGVADSRQASLVGKYWNAVERYRDPPGDASLLRAFRGKYIIDANGKRVRLLANLRELDRLGSAGVLSFAREAASEQTYSE